MKFAYLEDLWWLALISVVVLVLWLRHQGQKKAIITKVIGAARWRQAFGSAFSARMAKKNLIYGAALLGLVLALLRPQWGERLVPMPRQGVDIMFVVDVSLSMNAADLRPHRLERASREIKDLVHQLRGDRVGLISFAGGSFLQCPLTLDYGSFRLFLDELKPGMIPIPGTDIAGAVEMAVSAFRKDSTKGKVIVLITDGEDHGSRDGQVAALLAEHKVKLYAVSFGTDQGAPMVDPSTGSYIKEGNQLVISKPDFAGLKNLASSAGGMAFRSLGDSYGVAAAYEAIKRQVEDKKLAGGKSRTYREGYQFLLGLAVLLLLGEGILAYRRKLPLLSAVLVMLFAAVPPDSAFSQGPPKPPRSKAPKALRTPHPPGPEVLEPQLSFRQKLFRLVMEAPKTAMTDYRAGRFEAAYRQFLASYGDSETRAGSERSGFNLAAAAYRLGQFTVAEGLLAKFAATTPWNSVDKALVYYNLGNAKVETGKLDGALSAYKQALALKPEFREAAANHAYVTKLKAMLDKRQKPKKNPPKNGQGGKKPPQNSPQKNDKNEKKKGKPQQGKQGQDKQNGKNKNSSANQDKDGQKPSSAQDKPGQKPADQNPGKKPAKKPGDKPQGGGKGPSQTNAWQNQKALDRRNAERLLESIDEDRGKYLKRRMPQASPSTQGGKRW